MDEAQMLAPSQSSTASLYSTIVLASQARKYGLGLLFATQAPKGLHNQITGNATTQFFGRLHSPAQIAAANDMARAKGGTLGDIGGLGVGQFYVTSEKFGFRQLRSPFCLSHHPASPLRDEEVLDRARKGH
jgi:DNA helicase HerA-like ATPase